jgi:lipopolysaccharide/colanic/teichoic acid biosynthesis glycosyltransferase
VIGSDCVLSEHSVVKESIIFSGSFVGEDLELDQTLVDRNCMVNQRLNSELIVNENFILSGLNKNVLRHRPSRFGIRILAAMLLLLFSPWMLFLWLYSRLAGDNYSFSRQAFVRLPAESDPLSWQTGHLFSFQKTNKNRSDSCVEEESLSITPVGYRDFLFRVIPALGNVVLGDLCFVGVAPRTEAQIKRLPSDWRSIYLKCKPGIITESQINFGPTPSPDHLYSADALYSVSANVIYDAKLLGRYMLQLLGLESVPNR